MDTSGQFQETLDSNPFLISSSSRVNASACPESRTVDTWVKGSHHGIYMTHYLYMLTVALLYLLGLNVRFCFLLCRQKLCREVVKPELSLRLTYRLASFWQSSQTKIVLMKKMFSHTKEVSLSFRILWISC